MYEENFDEMQWALEELERNYILLKAYIAEKNKLKEEHTEKELLICEKIFHDTTKQFTDCYIDNLRIIL